MWWKFAHCGSHAFQTLSFHDSSFMLISSTLRLLGAATVVSALTTIISKYGKLLMNVYAHEILPSHDFQWNHYLTKQALYFSQVMRLRKEKLWEFFDLLVRWLALLDHFFLVQVRIFVIWLLFLLQVLKLVVHFDPDIMQVL